MLINNVLVLHRKEGFRCKALLRVVYETIVHKSHFLGLKCHTLDGC